MSQPDIGLHFYTGEDTSEDNNDLITIALNDLGALSHLKGSLIGLKNIIRG